MRSLWRDLALRWLGGTGSEALSFDVRHEPGLSRHAKMSSQAPHPTPVRIPSPASGTQAGEAQGGGVRREGAPAKWECEGDERRGGNRFAVGRGSAIFADRGLEIAI
jgi:hypothetical protein